MLFILCYCLKVKSPDILYICSKTNSYEISDGESFDCFLPDNTRIEAMEYVTACTAQGHYDIFKKEEDQRSSQSNSLTYIPS